MPKSRKTNVRKVNKRILILCEGKETEPNYFKGLKRNVLNRNKMTALRIVVHDTIKNTGKELVNEAKDLKKNAIKEANAYDDIWIVLDKDGYTKHPQTFDKAKANNINIAFSSISFEFWFLLHFKYTTQVFHKAEKLISYLKTNYMKNYSKADDNFSKLKDKTDEAVKNSELLRKNISFEFARGKKVYQLNSYTDVDILVSKLLNL